MFHQAAGLVYLSAHLFAALLADAAEPVAANTRPLVYTRLRHDDNYLQVLRNLQLERPYEEKLLSVKYVDPANESQTNELKFYQNSQVDANQLTYDDLIFEALDRTYKSRLIPSYIQTFSNPEDRARSSDPALVSERRCQLELKYLARRLADHQSAQPSSAVGPELAAFYDSYAAEEPGLLLGNYHWTGNWRQCAKRQIAELAESSVVNFRGRYCIAAISSAKWKAKIARQVERLSEQNYFKYPDQRYDYANFFRIQLGLCLPESCDSRALYQQPELIKQLATHRLRHPSLTSYQLVDLFCLPDAASELRQIEPAGWALIAFLVLWCACSLALSALDWAATRRASARAEQRGARSGLARLVGCMSLLRNWQRLVETESVRRALAQQAALEGQPASEAESRLTGGQARALKVRALSERNKPTADELVFLNAFKVISTPLIIYGHAGMLGEQLDRFPLDYESYENPLLFHFHASTVFFVDWYFAISGFLTCYVMFASGRAQRNTGLHWLYSLFHRYWRLAPLYLLLFAFCQHLFQQLSFGPVWDYGTSNMTLRAICRRESALWPLLMVPNLHPLHEECIMPAWYIGNDLQFYLLSPLLLVLLAKSAKLGWLLCVGALSASVLARAQRYLSDPRAQPLELMRPRFDLYMRNNWDLHPTYLFPHYRLPSYLIGLLAGHYAYMVRQGRWRSPLYEPLGPSPLARMQRHLRTLTWLAGAWLTGSMMFATGLISRFFPRSLEPHVRPFTALVYALDHASAALGVSLIFVALLLGHWPSLRRFLSHPLWTLVSRLNYFVYLVQVEVIYLLYQSSERVGDFSAREAAKHWLLITAISYSVSLVVTLLFEMPFAQLEREFVGSWVARKLANRNPAKNPPEHQPDDGRAPANLKPAAPKHDLASLRKGDS